MQSSAARRQTASHAAGNTSAAEGLKTDNSTKVVPPTTKPAAIAPLVPPAAERGTSERPAASAAGSPTPSQMPTLAAQRQAAALETLAQAQSLWNTGSRTMALELMHEAVLAAERNLRAGDQTSEASVLPQLVREWARMALAERQAAPVFELLTRLEPELSSQADLWAVRGNAAQRLGRHQDSVKAYLAALKLRPTESRWMLGAAVSLAAQGDLTAAAAWRSEEHTSELQSQR